MKLSTTDVNPSRCHAAALRNCLSYECAPLACPVRKCRRDGFCTGPLIAEDAPGRRRHARPDAADIAPGQNFAPVCYLHIADDARARIDMASASAIRDLDRETGADVIETTRTLASRRWRLLRGL